MRVRTWLAVAIAATSTAACGGNDGAGVDAGAMVCTEIQRDFPVAISRDLDLLFVVDTSPSMAGEADRLAVNAERFARVLDNIEGGLPNVHIGVVSADVDARGGALEAGAATGCAGPDGAFLRDVAYPNGERDANYDGSLDAALACMLALPATGGPIEQPLEAMRRALDGSNPGNAGFRRDTAFLMVVFVTDEDDCSGGAAFATGDGEDRSAWRCFDDGVVCDQSSEVAGTKTGCAAIDNPETLAPVADYADWLRTLAAYDGTIVVAATLANGDPVVSTSPEGPRLDDICDGDADARPAPRLADLLARFPQRNSTADVCGDDWTDSLEIIASLNAQTLGAACIDAAVDLEPDVDGVQADCSVVQAFYAGTPDEQQTVLPPCSSPDAPDTERPCWLIDADDPSCVDTGFGFRILRGRETVPPGTLVRTRCFAGC